MWVVLLPTRSVRPSLRPVRPWLTADRRDSVIKMGFLAMSQIRNATTLTLVVIVLCAGVLSSGCGQKGPLYIPETPASEESEDSDS